MTKIEAIKKTIFNLENNVIEYNWKNADSCNCGVLARTLLDGKSVWDCGFTNSPKRSSEGIFSSMAYCITTDLPLPEVFQKLKDAGFTHKELLELEYYGNEEVAKRLGKKIEYKESGAPYGWECEGLNNKSNLILYLKTWLQILEEKQPKQIQPKVIHHYVSVPETLKKELVTLN